VKEISIMLCFLVVALACMCAEANAQNIRKSTDTTSAQAQQEYEFLKQQVTEYREFVERERKQHQDFLENMYTKLVTIVSGFAVLITALLSFFGWQSKKDVAQTVKKLFEDHSLKLIDERNETIKFSVSELKRLLEKETKYQKKSILFLTSRVNLETFAQRELPIIAARGMKNYKPMTSIEEAFPLIKTEAYDVIVYYYNPSGEKPKESGDSHFRDIVEFLKTRQAKTPLIVYTYEKGENNQLFPIDREKLSAYPYIVTANFPITLVNVLHTVVNYFPVINESNLSTHQ